MDATTGFFQKCQQYFNFRGSSSSQNYQVGDDEDSDHYEEEEHQSADHKSSGISSRFSFQRSYQKVSTEDKLTK